MAKYLNLYVFLVLLVIQSQAEKLTRFDEEVKILEEILGKNKESLKLIRPPGEHTNVTVNLLVRNVLSICEKSHKWKVMLTFRQEWTDSRLAFTPSHTDFKYLLLNNEKQIWVPDLFFGDEVHSEQHDLMTNNVLIRVHPDGHITHSKRITLEMFCPINDMTKKEFHCPMKIASYGHTTDELDVHWKADEPVQINKNLVMNHFVLHEVTTKTCDSVTKMGTFDCIVADFKFGKDTCQVWE